MFLHLDCSLDLLQCSCHFGLVKIVVFLGVEWPCSLYSGARSAVSASVLDDVERAVAGSATVMEDRDRELEPLTVVTRSVVESVVDFRPSGETISSSLDLGPYVVIGVFLLAKVDALGPEVERLSVASSLSRISGHLCRDHRQC